VVIPSIEVGGSSLPSSQSVGEKMLGVSAPLRLVASSVFGCSPLLSSSSEVGISHEGNAKGFWDLMSKIDEEQLQ
jgi:hypothetical protein